MSLAGYGPVLDPGVQTLLRDAEFDRVERDWGGWTLHKGKRRVRIELKDITDEDALDRRIRQIVREETFWPRQIAKRRAFRTKWRSIRVRR